VTDATPAVPGEDPIRDALIAAAAEVFAEKGYDGAGVAEIARRAGYTTGAIYGRFTGKAELLLEAITTHTNSEFDDLFADHRFDGRVTDILTIVGSHLVTGDPGRERALLLEAFVAARRDSDVEARLREIVDQRAGRLGELVLRAKETGLVDPELDTTSVVRFAHAVGLAWLLFDAVGLERPDPAGWQELIVRMVGALADPSHQSPHKEG
jgi:AcrR family transcriptional regulator